VMEGAVERKLSLGSRYLLARFMLALISLPLSIAGFALILRRDPVVFVIGLDQYNSPPHVLHEPVVIYGLYVCSILLLYASILNLVKATDTAIVCHTS